MAVEWAYKDDFYKEKGIIHEESYFTNSRNMKLFTCSWKPEKDEVKGLIFLLHGYAVDCGLYWQSTATKLAENGYAVFGIDYEGHGRSDGTRGLLKGLDSVVNDFLAFSRSIRANEEYAKKPAYLFGLSLGGAVLLLVHRKDPTGWDGAVLQAPMLKIADNMKPHAIVTAILTRVAAVFPSLAIVPTKDVIDEANRDPRVRAQIRSNPYTYLSKPRLATAVTFVSVTEDIQSRLDEVTIPFLLMHGEKDTVTDPAVSAELYEKAKSFDKTFKLYPDMWHSLTEGELPENIEIVFKDILEWLNARTKATSSS